MLIFLVLCLVSFMIFTLVRNALVGIQLHARDSYQGSIELIIPLVAGSKFYSQAWIKSLQNLKNLKETNLRIHILIDSEHQQTSSWSELPQNLPFVEIHSFPLRPEGTAVSPWMIKQISSQLKGDIIIIGDAELVPDETAFISLAHHVAHSKKPFLILPQTAQQSYLGESIAVLNPTLALASVFGFKKFRHNLSHPLMDLAQGWLGMSREVFNELEWNEMNAPSWKQSIALQWDKKEQSWALGFGEKHLIRHYPEDPSVQIRDIKMNWKQLWFNSDRTGLGLFIAAQIIWFFPIACFWIFPIWSIATLIFLGIYRFFSKVVFQERWSSMLLHPIASTIWIITLLSWGPVVFKNKFGNKGPTKPV